MILWRSNLTEIKGKKMIRKEESPLVYYYRSEGKNKIVHISAIRIVFDPKNTIQNEEFYFKIIVSVILHMKYSMDQKIDCFFDKRLS
jgi:predicted KAP-like P-loop ATPase